MFQLLSLSHSPIILGTLQWIVDSYKVIPHCIVYIPYFFKNAKGTSNLVNDLFHYICHKPKVKCELIENIYQEFYCLNRTHRAHRGGGSENPYFCRTDFMDGPYSISKPCTSENILFFSDRNWWLLHPNKKNWSNWVHFGPISKLLLSPNSFYRLLLFFHFA